MNNPYAVFVYLKDLKAKITFLVELIIKNNNNTKVDEFFAFFFYDTN
jgi:hypothetical protein